MFFPLINEYTSEERAKKAKSKASKKPVIEAA